MKMPLLAINALIAVLLTGCVQVVFENPEGKIPDNKVMARVDREGAISAQTQKLVVDNQFGEVNVLGVDDRFGWQWELKCRAEQKMTAEDYVHQCQLEVNEANGVWRITLVLPKQKRLRSLQLESNLHVRVPKTASAEVRNSFGPTDVAGLQGPVRARCQSGKLAVKDINGAVDAATSFDALMAESVGPALLANQSGSIEAAQVAGDITAKTSFARLRVQNIKGTADLENQSGEITATGITGPIKARASFAPLQVEDTGIATLSNQSGAIDANHIRGNLTASTSFAAVNAKDVKGTADLDNQSGGINASGITGSIKAQTSFARMVLSGQGTVIHARNQSGAIEITALAARTTQIEAETSFSPIELSLPVDAKPLVRAETSFGKVHSDFPVVMMGTVSEAGFANDLARPKVTLKTQSGDIRIRKLSTPQYELESAEQKNPR